MRLRRLRGGHRISTGGSTGDRPQRERALQLRAIIVRQEPIKMAKSLRDRVAVESLQGHAKGRTHCMYWLTIFFMTAPVMLMQGRMAETARARRHERTYATGVRVSGWL